MKEIVFISLLLIYYY